MTTDNINENCIICYEKLSLKIYKCYTCKKEFHLDCMNKWTKINNSCPICRTSFIKLNDQLNEAEEEIDYIYDYFFDHEEVVLLDPNQFVIAALTHYQDIIIDFFQSICYMFLYAFLFIILFIFSLQIINYIILIQKISNLTI